MQKLTSVQKMRLKDLVDQTSLQAVVAELSLMASDRSILETQGLDPKRAYDWTRAATVLCTASESDAIARVSR